MKNFTKKSVAQKIIFAILIILLVNFTLAPHVSYAKWSVGGQLAEPIFQFLCWIGDVIMGGLNKYMLGASTGVGGLGSAMLDTEDANLSNDDSWLNPANYDDSVDGDAANSKAPIKQDFASSELKTTLLDGVPRWQVPNMLYCPENIFAGNIAALDINFLKENTYQSVAVDGEREFKKEAEKHAESATTVLKQHIANWYKAFRNISVVALLSILIYLGIRILISSTAADKAKHKEAIQSWFVALCLVFFIHIIMSGVLMLTDTCTDLFKANVERGYTVYIDGTPKFHTNLMGLIRFRTQSEDVSTFVSYTIIYLALVIYTVMFTIIYLKRFFYMAFFTMIAPLVSLTYPIDKIGDGKAQAFNMWFKEYTMNAIIQPVHLILYSLFVGAAADLGANNPFYALVAIGFLIPAEQFIKKMFGLEAQTNAGGMGAFAGGALAMAGLNQISKLGGGAAKKASGLTGGGKSEDGSKGLKWFADPNKKSNFSSLGDGKEDKDKKPINNNKEEDSEEEDSDNNKVSLNEMLEADDEKFGTPGERDANQREALDGEANDDYEAMLRSFYRNNDYTEEEIRDMFGDEQEPTSENTQDSTNDLQLGNSRENPQNPENDLQSGNSRRNPAISVDRGRRPQERKGWMGRTLIRGAKSLGKGVWKNKRGILGTVARTATRVTGATAGAAIGLAAGLTTGDFSKVAGNMVTGAAAGNIIGSNAYNAGASVLSRATEATPALKEDARYAIDEEKFGAEYARQEQVRRKREETRKRFLKDDAEKRKYREFLAKMQSIGYKGELNDIMNAVADYKQAEITDENLIQNSIKAEYKSGNKELKGEKHKLFVDVASFAHENNFGRDYIDDAKKRKQWEDILDAEDSLDDSTKREIGETYAEIFNRKPLYNKVGRWKNS